MVGAGAWGRRQLARLQRHLDGGARRSGLLAVRLLVRRLCGLVAWVQGQPGHSRPRPAPKLRLHGRVHRLPRRRPGAVRVEERVLGSSDRLAACEDYRGAGPARGAVQRHHSRHRHHRRTRIPVVRRRRLSPEHKRPGEGWLLRRRRSGGVPRRGEEAARGLFPHRRPGLRTAADERDADALVCVRLGSRAPLERGGRRLGGVAPPVLAGHGVRLLHLLRRGAVGFD